MSWGLVAPAGGTPWGPEEAAVFATSIDALAARRRRESLQRTLAIVTAVELEEALGRVLSAFCRARGRSARKVEAASFSIRIQDAARHGLISLDERADLDTIRAIRNRFAHTGEGAGFDAPEVVGLCGRLVIPTRRSDLFGRLDAEETFSATAFVLKENLYDREWRAPQSDGTVPDEIDSRQWEEFFE